MKGFIAKTVAVLCLGGGLAITSGCQYGGCQDLYYNCVDPCWPQRYSAMARASVEQATAAQVNNGHVLDQTIWNFHFEAGTDKLTPGGLYHLAYLARRRPAPDPHIYLQTAQDIAYDSAHPEGFVQARGELDSRRIAAVQKYLQVQTASRPVPFQVTVHDPGEVGMSAAAMLQSISRRDATFLGTLPRTGSSGFGASAGHAPAGGPIP
jgi:hypothetical protein